MKKYTVALVFAVMVALASCGSAETSAPVTNDSTKVDSVKVDSVKVDSAKIK